MKLNSEALLFGDTNEAVDVIVGLWICIQIYTFASHG